MRPITPRLAGHSYLLGQLVKRDVLLRYRGAMFGVAWAFLNPLLMLAVFAFVFGTVFEARWAREPGGPPFWVVLYSGLVVFNVFSETVSRAPASVRGQAHLVKKVIFPVELLPVVPLGAALVHGAFNLAVLAAALAVCGHLHAGILLVPLLAVPLVLFALGASWFLGAWGVFIKDMAQVAPVFVQLLLFLSPVFYPTSAVPGWLRPVYRLNPLGGIVEACRAASLGLPVPWAAWSAALVLGLAAAALGRRFFSTARDEFADVL